MASVNVNKKEVKRTVVDARRTDWLLMMISSPSAAASFPFLFYEIFFSNLPREQKDLPPTRTVPFFLQTDFAADIDYIEVSLF